VRRLGGEKDIKVDVRIISATHRNLPERIDEGEFREDLYHRISGATISVPPLRDRRTDIVPLTEFFLTREMTTRGKRGICFSENAMLKLNKYDFPGNVRELEKIVSSLVVRIGNNQVIGADKIILPTPKGSGQQHVTREEVHPELSINTSLSDKTNATPLSLPVSVNLSNLHEIIATLTVEKNDPALDGIKPRLENAVQALLQRCVGAALERYKRPGGKYELRPAMRLLTGNITLKGPRVIRELDKILNRQQKTTTVQQDELVTLVESWKSPKNKE